MLFDENIRLKDLLSLRENEEQKYANMINDYEIKLKIMIEENNKLHDLLQEKVRETDTNESYKLMAEEFE